MNRSHRPVFLSLHRIHLPLTGWVSITHRVTGVLLFLSLPFWLWLWQYSLRDAETFAQAQLWLAGGLSRLVLVLLLWWLIHHLLAGLRLLLMDLEFGTSLPVARRSAQWVAAGSLISLLLLLVLL